MADYGFWRELAAEFGALDTHGELRADWHQTARMGEPTPPTADWRIVAAGSYLRSISFSFQSSARRGGMEIHPAMDSMVAWLEELRSRGLNHEPGPIASEVNPEGGIVACTYTGTISNVCHASADLCKIFESVELEIERLRRVKAEMDRISPARDGEENLHKELDPHAAVSDPPKTNTPSFPKRAKWADDRLKEREWDWNHPSRFGGPDRKTVKKILAGKYVQIGALAKLVTALNRIRKGKNIEILDIPTD
jgi:hypothetical protein